MDATIICAIISGAVTLLVSIGTWQLSAKKDRAKTTDSILKTLDEQYEKTRTEVRSLQDDISQVNATVQNQISIIEVRIDALTKQVEKHNNVIERTFKLEQAVEDLRKNGRL